MQVERTKIGETRHFNIIVKDEYLFQEFTEGNKYLQGLKIHNMHKVTGFDWHNVFDAPKELEVLCAIPIYKEDFSIDLKVHDSIFYPVTETDMLIEKLLEHFKNYTLHFQPILNNTYFVVSRINENFYD